MLSPCESMIPWPDVHGRRYGRCRATRTPTRRHNRSCAPARDRAAATMQVVSTRPPNRPDRFALQLLDEDPIDALQALRHLREQIEGHVQVEVLRAFAEGRAQQEVARALGVSQQAVSKKYGELREAAAELRSEGNAGDEHSPRQTPPHRNAGFSVGPRAVVEFDLDETTQAETRHTSLPEVLIANAPERFFLSPKACAGILTRADRAGRHLPALLRAELERVAALAEEP